MSAHLNIDNEFSLDLDQLLRLVAACKELIKEKEMLKESKSKSDELIKILELNLKSLSEARSKDFKYTQELEEELRKCYEKIGYMQDQLNLRNIEANCLGEHVHSLELKLAEAGKLQEKLSQLNEEVIKGNFDCFFLKKELENKEADLQNSTLCITRLEETISSIAMESQCEIESIKLDLLSLEEMSLETKKFPEERIEENAAAEGVLEELKIELQDSFKTIECLEKENQNLKAKLQISKSEDLGIFLENKSRSGYDAQSSSKQENELSASKVPCCEEISGMHVSKSSPVASDENLKDEMDKMLNQIHEYELLVKQLKDELKEEKSRSKEEAEDLTQEMAELRYQIMGMLEEECKRRSCIEQASLQRITELEEQVRKEKKKSAIASMRLQQVQKLAESRSVGLHHMKKLSEDSHASPQGSKICSCGECETSRCILMDCSTEELLEVKCVDEGFAGDSASTLLAWIPRENHGVRIETSESDKSGVSPCKY
ncbi:hypothetical protein Scep_019652 [Stephania cephalantha]|uniref:Uncharacterized protein n=1 Tax=Stephania cephalantha TaxID=152367 RepID=A0AAP0NMC7_9MAGN